ncbi:two-component sensor histidine kinase [Microbacterium faecale]|uniref:histidine kinase n=1 Tax=Microbacterium faecale TaxID=1804630 RepID=A0A916YDZ8_9MICO|nr:sensor histidine kinase [Microbacterium faecale]GGD41573.1 two-component sensor histidine kinase [Microbacterium faecale]
MRPAVDPRVSDAALALAVALMLAVVIAAHPAGAVALGAYAFAVAFGAILLLRRRLSRVVLVATVLGIFAYYTLDLPPVGMVLPAIGALFSGAEQRRTRWTIGSASVLVGVAIFFRLSENAAGQLTGYSLVTELALAAASIALGSAVRLARETRERSAEVARLTEAQERHAADARMHEERLRIARDLHDTIGHTLSVASLHAGVAAEATDAIQRADALGRVRTAASDALRELRRTVRFLRSDNAARTSATPGLTRIDEVVAAARESGLSATVDVSATGMPTSVDAAAFRIVQESLTNVLRHADATVVDVAVHVVGAELVIRVADDGRTAGPVREGSGIRGMRERAGLLGGTLDAAATPTGFVVEARIPVHDKEDA